MPNWARLPSTRKDVSLGYRMGSAFENGSGDEGPLAKFLAIGGCFGLIIFSFLGLLALVGGVGWGVWSLLVWIF